MVVNRQFRGIFAFFWAHGVIVGSGDHRSGRLSEAMILSSESTPPISLDARSREFMT